MYMLKGFKNIKSYLGGWIFFHSVSLLIMYWLVLGDLGPSQSQKLAHEMRLSLTLINSSPTPSTTDVG